MNISATNKYIPVVLLALTVCFCAVMPAFGATYYVRLDGGKATQCTGKVNAPYPGAGTGQPCAFAHPFSAFGVNKGSRGPFVGGDTLIIQNGSYKMGYGAGFSNGNCDSTNYTYDCFMNSVPSGPDPTHPSRILGEEWNTGCSKKPELWATERAYKVLNLEGSSNVEVQCLDITDHASCGYYGGQYGGETPCHRSSYPHGDYGDVGIKSRDSSSVFIKNVNVHGFSEAGIHAARLKDWTLEDTNIIGNAFVGWNGDLSGDDSNSGTITFNRVKVLYNGCIENHKDGTIFNCLSQSQGGYGDGLGMGTTGANWVFNECDISHNSSDGLDLLYHNGNGTVTVKRSRFEGNAGNQLKTASGGTSIENSLMIGNCDYFVNNPITWRSSGFDHCRARGNTVAFTFRKGTKVNLYNSTLTGRGDVIVESNGDYSCDGTEVLKLDNDIFMGNNKYANGELVTFYYASGGDGDGAGPCGAVRPDTDYSDVYNVKNGCPTGGDGIICQNPKFVGPLSGNNWNVTLQSTSPAIRKALVLTGKSSLDYLKKERGDVWDIGAIEYEIAASGPTCAQDINYCLTQEECVAGGYYWYNNKCNAVPEPLPTCAQDILYCTTSSDCTANGYYWYNNVCHLEPEPVPTCAQGIQYCLTSTECTANGYYWYNNTCNAKPEPLPTCADGIQYCTTSADCTAYGHFWYDNSCHAEPKPLTCADGIQYCTTASDCESNGHFWYNNTCNVNPQPTCADGIQYCLTSAECTANGYYWYNGICNTNPEPVCSNGIQYCLTSTECEANGHYWYNNTCNTDPKPLTCADGIQYCTTSADCTAYGHFWYDNSCHAEPKPLTCADGIQYCTTASDCESNGHYWYNNTCNVNPQPTCADGIQYCLTSVECEANGHYWYNNACHAEPQPLPTCVDGAQYCLTSTDCIIQGYYWYNNVCNLEPEPVPTCADNAQYCTKRSDCINAGHFWYGNSCHAEPEKILTCADSILYCTTKPDCTKNGYYWYDNSCHAVPQPTCADGIQYCTTKLDCTNNGFYWYNNACHIDAEPVSVPQSQPPRQQTTSTETTGTIETALLSTDSGGTTTSDISLLDTNVSTQDTSTDGETLKNSSSEEGGGKGFTDRDNGSSSSGSSGGGGLALSSGGARGGSNGSESGSSAIGGGDSSKSVQSGPRNSEKGGRTTSTKGTVIASPRPSAGTTSTDFTVTQPSQPDTVVLEEAEADLDGETYADLRKKLLSQGGGSEVGSPTLGAEADQQTGEGAKSFMEEFIAGVKQLWSNVVNWFAGLGGNG